MVVEYLKEITAVFSVSRKVAATSILFAFIGGFLYSRFPDFFHPIADKYPFIIGCFVLGGALQRTGESLIRYLFPKATQQVRYYEDLQELHRDYQRGLIPADTYSRIADQLIEKRFLGNASDSPR